MFGLVFIKKYLIHATDLRHRFNVGGLDDYLHSPGTTRSFRRSSCGFLSGVHRMVVNRQGLLRATRHRQF